MVAPSRSVLSFHIYTARPAYALSLFGTLGSQLSRAGLGSFRSTDKHHYLSSGNGYMWMSGIELSHLHSFTNMRAAQFKLQGC